jgi:hypothetical protein
MIKLVLEHQKHAGHQYYSSNDQHFRHINRTNLNFCAMTMQNVMMWYLENWENVGSRNASNFFLKDTAIIFYFLCKIYISCTWLWEYQTLKPVIWSDTLNTQTDSSWSRSCHSFSRPLHASKNSQASWFEYLTVVSVNIIVIWDGTPNVSIRENKSYGKKCSLRQGIRVLKQYTERLPACCYMWKKLRIVTSQKTVLLTRALFMNTVWDSRQRS